MTYVDATTGYQLGTSVTLTGRFGTQADYQPTTMIAQYTQAGYVLMGSDYPATGVTFNQAGVVQKYTVYLAHNKIAVTAPDQLTKTITQTVHYQDQAGHTLQADTIRTLTFTKSIAGFVITLSTPLEANSQPTRANIKVTRDIPAGGTFKVEATNNPFDASPVWEDCTNAVVQGVAHVFTNKINTAAQYGMNIRVTVQRGDALTACWVSGIGGNFE